jgi:ABC-2 type transport system permease protein
MTKYRAIAKLTFKSIFNYKASVVILGLQSLTQLIVMLFLWQAVFQTSQTIQGYHFDEMVQYYLGVTVLSYFCFFAIDWEVNSDVHSGNFGNILLKPVPIMAYYFSRMIGDRLANLCFALLPIGIISIFLLRTSSQIQNLATLLLSVLSIFLAMVLWFFLSFAVAMLAFWLENIFFILTVKEIIIQFFSGLLIPMAFFPKTIQHVLAFLPFRYLAYEPMQLFNGFYSPQVALAIVCKQVIWTVILFLSAKGLLKLGLKKYTNVSG